MSATPMFVPSTLNCTSLIPLGSVALVASYLPAARTKAMAAFLADFAELEGEQEDEVLRALEFPALEQEAELQEGHAVAARTRSTSSMSSMKA